LGLAIKPSGHSNPSQEGSTTIAAVVVGSGVVGSVVVVVGGLHL
jgi:hypothetical protein